MTSSRSDHAEQGHGKETERYRQAADDALQQLDWCIGYLHGIRKVQISRALARNRTVIRTTLLNRPEEPLPTSRTGE
jgi:hypothetical protein